MTVYQRRREMKTNYEKRLALLKSGKNRVVVRLSNLYLHLLYIEHNPKGDITKFSLTSKSLKSFCWPKGYRSLPACYLAGFLFGKEVIKRKLGIEAVLDLGLQNAFKKGRLFAGVKGMIDSGLKIPASLEAFPPEDRLKGKHNKTEQLFNTVKSTIDAKFAH